jgi:hypothetical protein
MFNKEQITIIPVCGAIKTIGDPDPEEPANVL